jgi:hypothetical protein
VRRHRAVDFAQLVGASCMRPDQLAEWLGVSLRTLRRYQVTNRVPAAVAIAVQRLTWFSPEQLDYAEYLAYWRGVEANKRLLGSVGPGRRGVVLAWSQDGARQDAAGRSGMNDRRRSSTLRASPGEAADTLSDVVCGVSALPVGPR